jgi:hypothetical protein
MNLQDLAEIWALIKPSIKDGDPSEAADLLVNHLIDIEGHDPAEIKKVFGADSDVREALSYFSTDEDEEEYNEDDDYEEEELDF